MKCFRFRTALALVSGLLAIMPVLHAGVEERGVVSIKATKRIAEETSAPLRRIRFDGEFTVSRTGATNNAQPVWILISGSATQTDDYEPIPWLVTIPEGESSVSLPVNAVRDNIPEGIETVVAQISNCPPPFVRAPCYEFAIDASSDRDTVFIREDGLTVATVQVTSPESGSSFPLGETINLEAVAIHLESYISRVEFWDGDSLIGVSEIFFVRAPDPGTPIHHQFAWQRAAPGGHTVTARATIGERETIVSPPVRIIVGEISINLPPRVGISSPSSGDVFRPGSDIPVVVETVDPDGFVPLVEFFANGEKIGEVAISFLVEPLPGQSQTITFSWEDVPAGSYALTARATDNDGARGQSFPVGIRVIPEDTNRPPEIAIVTPRDGQEFRVREPVPIVAEGIDPDGFIKTVEFYADGRKIGEDSLVTLVINPPVGRPQRFEFSWEGALPGRHVLTARAIDNRGARGESQRIGIVVVEPDPDPVPIIGVIARDAFGVEPVPGAPPNPCVFQIWRHGSESGDLRVRYSLHGRAENGVDYEELSGVAVIPDGSSSVAVVVNPLSDDEHERRESVILALEESPAYRIGRHGKAYALIADRPWIHRGPGMRCVSLDDGLVHFCIPMPTGRRCRVEGSDDLSRWSTLLELIAVDGVVHFVSEREPGRRSHFCRLIEEPEE